jgi:hypothetical protein
MDLTSTAIAIAQWNKAFEQIEKSFVCYVTSPYLHVDTMPRSTKHVTILAQYPRSLYLVNRMPDVLLSHKLDAPLGQPQLAPFPPSPLTAKVTVMPSHTLLPSVISAKTKMQAIKPIQKITKTKKRSTKKAAYETSSASTAHSALSKPIETLILESWDAYDWQKSSDALADWINGRWGKTGYSVSKEVVCFTLRMNGRDARLGLGDHLGGSFYRGEKCD